MQVVEVHSALPVAGACPICVSFYGGDPTILEKDLVVHLRETHPEMAGATNELKRSKVSRLRSFFCCFFSDIFFQSIISADPFDLAKEAAIMGSAFAALVLRENECGGECAICLGEFEAGQAAMRMNCFCLYHSECICAWFAKSKKNSCPTHVLDH